MDTVDREIEAEHPEGGLDRVVVHVSPVPALILLKGLALSRQEDRDAYDICYLIQTYRGGIAGIAEALIPYLTCPAGRCALAEIRAKYASRESIGPKRAAAELTRVHGGDPRIHRTMSFELVAALLRELGDRE